MCAEKVREREGNFGTKRRIGSGRLLGYRPKNSLEVLIVVWGEIVKIVMYLCVELTPNPLCEIRWN